MGEPKRRFLNNKVMQCRILCTSPFTEAATGIPRKISENFLKHTHGNISKATVVSLVKG